MASSLIAIDGYSIVYLPEKNCIQIGLPPTTQTPPCMTALDVELKRQRKVDLTDNELLLLLLEVKNFFEEVDNEHTD